MNDRFSNSGVCFYAAMSFVMVLLLIPSTLPAQVGELRFDRLSIEDGLSQSNIQWILQDHYGFIWFSTQDGLNKYDGYTFTVYSHDPQNPSSLAGNALRQMYEDREGNIWIFLGIGGLNKFERATETFKYYNSDPRNPNSLSSDVVSTIFEDRSGKFWIGTSAGLDQLDPRTEKIIHYKRSENDTNEARSNIVTSILEDTSGLLWFGTQYGVKRYNPEQEHFSAYILSLSSPVVTFLYDDNEYLWIGTTDGLNKLEKRTGKVLQFKHYQKEVNSLTGNVITFIYQDKSDCLWIGTTEGLTKFDEKTSTYSRYQHSDDNPYSLSDNHIKSLLEDSNGMIWITTGGGHLNIFDKQSGRVQHIRNIPSDPKSLSNSNVSSVFEDRSGTIWIGTQGGGINKFNRMKQKFRYYGYDPTSRRGLSSNSVTAIFESRDGTLWIGTQDKGLNRYDRKAARMTYYLHDPDHPGGLAHNFVTAIFEDHDGELWIGTQNGLDNFDKGTQTFKHFRHSQAVQTTLSHNTVNCILEDHLGSLWIGTDSGLNLFDKKKKRFTYFLPDPADSHSISSRLVWSLFEDRDGSLWVGTAIGGLNKFDRKSQKFYRFEYRAQNFNGINNRTVNVMYESAPTHDAPAGTLWIGTYSGGLNKFDKSTQSFTHFTEREGLPNNRINGILEDNKGNLWLSTNKGLTRFNPGDLTVRTYNFTDGLQSNEFTRGAYCKTQDGEFFFGGINGMNSFTPERIQDNPYIPPIVLTSFKKFDKPVRFFREISSLDEITLSYQDNFFSIEFAALDYADPQKNQYAYRMEGFDYDWIYSGERRYASYTNLDPGDYIFRFKGSNNNAVWNETGKSIAIHITPPYYKTVLFRVAMILTMIGMVYISHRIRVRNIHTQKKKLEDLVQDRTRELHHKTTELQAAHDEMEHRVFERTAELRASNELLRRLKDFNENLIQTMAEGITVFDENGFITYVNPAMTTQLGYREDELIGKHWAVLVPSNLHHVVNEADERRKRGIADHYEIQMIRKDGIRNFFLVGGSPAFENGKFIGTFTVITNITERKRAEEQIKDQAALIESARDAIIVCNVEGKIIYWNSSAELIYGWKKDEIIGKDVALALYRENSPEHVEALRSALEKGEWSGELHQSRKDSRIVIVDSRWTLLYDHEGFPKSILLINTDITERVKLQMQFLRTQRLESLGTLASGIAHDLNNVLAPILMAVQILKNKIIDDGSHKLLETLEGSAKRASGIVRQVLTFARGAEGKKEELQPKHFVGEVTSIIHETFPKTIELKTDIKRDLWNIYADPTHLHQILLNLSVNARDAMPEGGILTIAAENITLDETYARLHPQAKPGPYVVFTVADTGTGMTKDVIEKIFEPFFTTKGVGKGTGLGLSTVTGIVKTHGGFINVYSEPGKGSSFKIFLPAGSSSEAQSKEFTAVSLPSGDGEFILVVDDEVAIRQITKGTLETYGYHVLTANNGIEAEEIFRKHIHQIDLLLTDMMMPSRGGAETISVLRSLKPQLKVIVASGLVTTEHLSAELGKTVQAFLPKPYTAEKLLRTIHEVLSGN